MSTHTDSDGNPKCCASCASYTPDGKGFGACKTWDGLQVAGIALCVQWSKGKAPLPPLWDETENPRTTRKG